MKEAKEYLKYRFQEYDPVSQKSIYNDEGAIEAIQEAQKEAVEYALKMAASNAEVEEELGNMFDPESIYYIVDEDSILKLKDKIFKEMGIDE